MNQGKFELIGGKRMWIADYSGLKSEELAQVIKDTSEAFVKLIGETGEESVPTFIDVTGSIATKEVVKALKESVGISNKYISKCAVIGVTQIQNVILRGIAMLTPYPLKSFGSKEEALEWLSQ